MLKCFSKRLPTFFKNYEGTRTFCKCTTQFVTGSGLEKLSFAQKDMQGFMKEHYIKKYEKYPDIKDFNDREEMAQCCKHLESQFMGLMENFPEPDQTHVEKLDFTPENAPGLTCDVTVWRPREQKEDSPGFVYVHGGGFAILTGKENPMQARCAQMANMGGVVMNVHFVNSTEEPFPRQLNDSVNAVKWFYENREKFGVMPNKGFCIYGESAGGNLCITTGMALKDSDMISSIFSMCPYTIGHMEDDVSKSWIENWNGGMEEYANVDDIVKSFEYCYTSKDSENYKNPLAWPYYATGEDIKGLAPIMIQGDEVDGIYDQSVKFYNLCQSERIPSWHTKLSGMSHAHMGEMLWSELMTHQIFNFGKIQMRDPPPSPQENHDVEN